MECSKNNKILCGKCNTCLKRSFANHSSSKNLYPKNTDVSKISMGSHTKLNFKCDKCNHIYQACPHKLSGRNDNYCPYCTGYNYTLTMNVNYVLKKASHQLINQNTGQKIIN